MDNQKQQILERIQQANNILITVSANPSVDQLAACLGLTIMLNDLGKHATAVFSGAVPSTIEFLQPEKTIEKNTDSLRDFIIALDKSKADKLRYKVEDTVVKIFITPYRTSISDKDLEFSQGDFNVEAVIALGVHDQKDLDQAITAHGRILHDATVISINTTSGNNLGTINWQDTNASSLSEMVSSLAENFDKKVLDGQVATALLTGIVAETERFSNDKTTPETMKASALLMAAGANQQLVASKLQEPPPVVEAVPKQLDDDTDSRASEDTNKPNDGTLRIDHAGEEPADTKKEEHNESSASEDKDDKKGTGPQIHIDDSGELHSLEDNVLPPLPSTPPPPAPTIGPPPSEVSPTLPPKPELPTMHNEDREFLSGPGPSGDSYSGGNSDSAEDDEKPSGEPSSPDGPKMVFTPPALGGTLTANSRPEALDPATDPLSSSAGGSGQPILSHSNKSSTPPPSTPSLILPPTDAGEPPKSDSNPQVIQPTVPDDDAGGTSEPPLPLTLPEPAITPPSVVTPVMTTPVTPLGADDMDAPAPSTPSAGSDDAIPPDVGSARDAVSDAIATNTTLPPPITALNAQPLGGPLHNDDQSASTPTGLPAEPLGNPGFDEPAPDPSSPSAQPLDMPLPQSLTPPPPSTTPPTSSKTDSPGAPPPVPPPMMPPIGGPGF